jgi:hypothetical protein
MHRKALIALLCAAAVSAIAIAPTTASAWAPAETAPIHPGVMTFTEGAQCTSNFVFQDGQTVFLGQAADCSGTGAATETNGCEDSLPIGTPVELDGATRAGTLAYNSWITMQQVGEGAEETCAYNDLAVIRLDPADVPNVNPSVPAFGGPTGVGSWGGTGSTVYTYGNSSLRGGVTALSGSGFLSSSGGAIGVLSTVQLAPLAASNGVGDLPKEIGHMKAHGFSGTNLVPGTEPFNPNEVGAALRGLGP